MDDVKGMDTVIEDLKGMGFNTLPMRDARAADGADIVQIVSMMKTFMLAVLIVALFFISYFIIRIVLKSRNAYYTTLRTLGSFQENIQTAAGYRAFRYGNSGVRCLHGSNAVGICRRNHTDFCSRSGWVSRTYKLCDNVLDHHRYVLYDLAEIRQKTVQRFSDEYVQRGGIGDDQAERSK